MLTVTTHNLVVTSMASLGISGLVVVLLTYFTPTPSEGVKIAAFNVQTFGITKYGKENVMSHIEQILRRYDVCLVQEIRDKTETVIPGLLQRLRNNGENWDVKYSERLGRSSYKEQYAYYYRTDKVTVVSDFQYDDGPDDGSDPFEREPYGVLFDSVSSNVLQRFGLLGIHIKPSEAVEELNALPGVIEAAKVYWNTQDIMIMGDFNAECSYVNIQELSELTLRTDSSYLWLIGDEVDTTVSSTDCAYDRMVVTGETFKQSIVPNSATKFPFDEEFSLTADDAREVSDHYPVEVEVR